MSETPKWVQEEIVKLKSYWSQEGSPGEFYDWLLVKMDLIKHVLSYLPENQEL